MHIYNTKPDNFFLKIRDAPKQKKKTGTSQNLNKKQVGTY